MTMDLRDLNCTQFQNGLYGIIWKVLKFTKNQAHERESVLRKDVTKIDIIFSFMHQEFSNDWNSECVIFSHEVSAFQ